MERTERRVYNVAVNYPCVKLSDVIQRATKEIEALFKELSFATGEDVLCQQMA